MNIYTLTENTQQEYLNKTGKLIPFRAARRIVLAAMNDAAAKWYYHSAPDQNKGLTKNAHPAKNGA